jgi:hypothetical protein
MAGYQADDLAAIREEGSLVALFTQLAGQTLKPESESEPEPDDGPSYHISRPGAWPCGTAPAGAIPVPCGDCQTTPPDPRT